MYLALGFMLSQKGLEKGKTIVYTRICMADYLLPEAKLTVKEKIYIFSLRCQINDNPYYFGEKILCQMGCSIVQDNEQILNCPLLSKADFKVYIEYIRNCPIYQNKKILKTFIEHNERFKQHLRDSVTTVNPL